MQKSKKFVQLLKKIPFLRYIYRSEYSSPLDKRIWIFGIIRKTIRINGADTLSEIRKNYQKKMDKLKNINRPLKIIFLIDDPAKWQYQSVYDAMEKSNNFDPLVVVVPEWTGTEKPSSVKLNELYHFFLDKKIKVEYGYDLNTKTFLHLESFAPDIIFYQHPWNIAPIQNILLTSTFALSCYCPYAIVENPLTLPYSDGFKCALTFHFVADDTAKKEILSYNNQINNIIVTGHPKLDTGLQVITQHIKKFHKATIVYAPHHSFKKGTLRWATFKWSGLAMLELVKKYPEFNWVLKPHPRFIRTVIRNKIMSKKEINTYYAEWKKHGQIVESGNYFELFAESDLMVTDCGSFLVEYLLTKKPLIHLNQSKAEPHTLLNAKILTSYYSANTTDELNDLFDDLCVKHHDPMKEQREQMFKSCSLGHATDNILHHLIKIKEA